MMVRRALLLIGALVLVAGSTACAAIGPPLLVPTFTPPVYVQSQPNVSFSLPPEATSHSGHALFCTTDGGTVDVEIHFTDPRFSIGGNVGLPDVEGLPYMFGQQSSADPYQPMFFELVSETETESEVVMNFRSPRPLLSNECLKFSVRNPSRSWDDYVSPFYFIATW